MGKINPHFLPSAVREVMVRVPSVLHLVICFYFVTCMLSMYLHVLFL